MEERILKQNLLVEEMGRHFEKEGMQPAASRIFALLMISDKEELTFEEIIDYLQISKSSASNALKLLEFRELVDYTTYPGDRKRYFRVKTAELFGLIEEFENKMERVLSLNEKILSLKADQSSRLSVFLKDFNQMIKYFQQTIDSFKQNYEQENHIDK